MAPVDETKNESDETEFAKEVHVTFKLPEEESPSSNNNNSECVDDCDDDVDDDDDIDNAEEKPFDSDHIDSKTLKYQYQSVQNELKKQIEQLENKSEVNQQKITELEKELIEQKQIAIEKTTLTEMLKQELQVLQQKLKDNCNEYQRLQDKFGEKVLSVEEISALEEELVLVKEKYAQLVDEKTNLNQKLNQLQKQYNIACNKSHNVMFFYIAPLVLMILYLLISSITS